MIRLLFEIRSYMLLNKSWPTHNGKSSQQSQVFVANDLYRIRVFNYKKQNLNQIKYPCDIKSGWPYGFRPSCMNFGINWFTHYSTWYSRVLVKLAQIVLWVNDKCIPYSKNKKAIKVSGKKNAWKTNHVYKCFSNIQITPYWREHLISQWNLPSGKQKSLEYHSYNQAVTITKWRDQESGHVAKLLQTKSRVIMVAKTKEPSQPRLSG